MLSPLIKKAMPQTTLFSGKRVRRGLYKTNRGLSCVTRDILVRIISQE
ncbi:hypothetical protein [Anaerobutyricum hallii]